MPATRAGVVSGDRRVDFVPSAHQNAPLADRSKRIRGVDRRWREIRAAVSFLAAVISRAYRCDYRWQRTGRVQMRDQRRPRVGTGSHGQGRRRAHVAILRNIAGGSAPEP
jgi:hypothetical protein